ncbi:pantoate--beta-alanine ligase [Phocaeicola oris]|nr:pantoate--beta-alanine ligase [Phocaeicola oris]MCE2617132.1 pantoate--beta-alanine ligase [Phocaeicola oris]
MIQVVHEITKVREIVEQWRQDGYTVGLVPTMGFLHAGHKSLIDRAVSDNDRVVVSVFVNPIQFGPNEDLARYPRDLEADTRLCQDSGAHLIFNPAPEEMYADGFCSFVDMIGPTSELCGKSRPGHFRGVCTVVNKLFNIVRPDRAYFGQKDAQQLAVIHRMVTDLNIPVEIVPCPIVRENDGLALSSRNTYLSTEERQAALVLSKAIRLGQQLVADGQRNAHKVVEVMKRCIEAEPLAEIDYVEAVDFHSIQKIDTIRHEVLFAMAVYIGKTRLIDNFIVNIDK